MRTVSEQEFNRRGANVFGSVVTVNDFDRQYIELYTRQYQTGATEFGTRTDFDFGGTDLNGPSEWANLKDSVRTQFEQIFAGRLDAISFNNVPNLSWEYIFDVMGFQKPHGTHWVIWDKHSLTNLANEVKRRIEMSMEALYPPVGSLQMYVWEPTGHGQHNIAVTACSEQEAYAAVAAYIKKQCEDNPSKHYDFRGWGTDSGYYKPVQVFGRGGVITFEND